MANNIQPRRNHNNGQRQQPNKDNHGERQWQLQYNKGHNKNRQEHAMVSNMQGNYNDCQRQHPNKDNHGERQWQQQHDDGQNNNRQEHNMVSNKRPRRNDSQRQQPQDNHRKLQDAYEHGVDDGRRAILDAQYQEKEKLQKIPPDFTKPDTFKYIRRFVIDAIYSSKYHCHFCAWRSNDVMQFRTHLDMHIAENMAKQNTKINPKQSQQQRGWYAQNWQPKIITHNTKKEEQKKIAIQQEEQKQTERVFIETSEISSPMCMECGEDLQEAWNDEKEAWVVYDCCIASVNNLPPNKHHLLGQIVHIQCLANI